MQHFIRDTSILSKNKDVPEWSRELRTSLSSIAVRVGHWQATKELFIIFLALTLFESFTRKQQPQTILTARKCAIY